VKEKEYAIDCWVGYLNFLKVELGRSLSEKEIKICMQKYIHGVKAEKCLEALC
jgi:hypothetical protein